MDDSKEEVGIRELFQFVYMEQTNVSRVTIHVKAIIVFFMLTSQFSLVHEDSIS